MSKDNEIDSPNRDDSSANQDDTKQLFHHAKNYLKASVFVSLLSSFTFLIFTYLLNVEEYGYLSIFNSLVSVFTILYLLNGHSGVARLLLDKLEDWGSILGASLLFTGLWVLVFSSGLLFFSEDIAAYFKIPKIVLICALIVSIFSSLYQYLMIYLSTDQQSARHSRISIRKKTISVFLGLLLVYSFEQDRYLGKIYTELIIGAVFFVYAFYELYKLAQFKAITRSHLSVSLRYGLPLIPHTLSRFILGYFDQLQINQISGGADTGRYAFAANIAIFMGFIVTASGKAWHPIFIENYQKGAVIKIEKMSRPYANKIFLAASFISLFVGDFIYLLVPKTYHSSVPLIPIIVLGYVCVFIYTLYFQYTAYRKKTELISTATLLAGVFNIILNAYYIPLYGYEAAAYTTLVSYGFLLLLHYLNARVILKEHVIRFRTLLPGFAVTSVVLFIASYLYRQHQEFSLIYSFGIKGVLLVLVLMLFYRSSGENHGPRETHESD
jgi:O-antigen/teichoic acid export membrane protein